MTLQALIGLVVLPFKLLNLEIAQRLLDAVE